MLVRFCWWGFAVTKFTGSKCQGFTVLVGVAGLHFIVDSDITNLTRFTLDRAGRSIMVILRHCGRIREVRGGGFTRYCVFWVTLCCDYGEDHIVTLFECIVSLLCGKVHKVCTIQETQSETLSAFTDYLKLLSGITRILWISDEVL